MTWTFGAGARASRSLGVLLAAGCLIACGSDSATARIIVELPQDGAVLTMADDVDPDTDGLQVVVRGFSSGLKPGNKLEVWIDADSAGVQGEVRSAGDFAIDGVTLAPGTHDIRVGTPTGSVSSDPEHAYTFKGLLIASPEDGAMLRIEDDEDMEQAGIQISVTVESFAIDLDEQITLRVDDREAGSNVPDAQGLVVFDRVTLLSGTHRLKATTGADADLIESDEISVDVREGCAALTFTEPSVPEGATAVMLGGRDACPTGEQPFTTTVAISTDAGNGRPAQLFVNGQPVASGQVDGASAVFEDVPLGRKGSANTIAVEVENSDGVTCREELGVDVLVDCAGPDCTIESPTPVTFTDGAGVMTLYLNAAQRGPDGFELEVASSAEAAGQPVSLIIDGDLRDAFTETAVAAGGAARATFSAVALSEGAHTVEARCVDPAGNETFSGELSWVVDTSPCLVDITDPATDALLVPADDTNAAADGTQVLLSTGVGRTDCVAQRTARCDPDDGVEGVDFVPYDGTSPLLSTVELDAGAVGQTLCVEIQDRAGNVGLGSVDVRFVTEAPTVQIEAPADGDDYNALGDGGSSPDADPATEACEADFSLACDPVGALVELRHDSAEGNLFASADCLEPASGDPALPDGFGGRATVRAAFLPEGLSAANVVALPVLAGSSGKRLLGAPQTISLTGDCTP